ncbi:MAG: ABC transporter permease [Eubacterium sp.]|nr:ABC transporter permease [Eubacterium sp.]
MNFRENLRLAWSCVRSNRMRSFLTMLGIIIGISAVITITTIGSSLKQSIATSVNELAGVNTLYAYITTDDYDDRDWDAAPHIMLDDLKTFQEIYKDDINAIGAEMGLGDGKYETNQYELKYSVRGETGSAIKTYGVDVVQGRAITMQDSIDKRQVVVVSDAFAKYAFGNKDPIGEKISLKLESGLSFEAYIIGVYEYDVNRIGDYSDRGKPLYDVTTMMFVPLNYLYELTATPKSERVTYFFNILAKPGVDPDKIIVETEAWFNTNCVDPDSNWYVEVESLEKQLTQITSMLNVITVAISIIAAISLIVGGIGIMNIMLVSVVERTKEIGIRKALGAKNKVIERQFLVEAVLICSIGGIIGIVLGLINGALISVAAKSIVATTEYSFISVVVRPPITAIIVSFGFSMLVGVVFGLYPAKRAARLSPIDALRYE